MFSSMGSCVFFLLAIVVVGWPLWRIFEKAGYPGIASVLSYIPIVNIVVLWYAALNEWPLERRARELGGTPLPPPR